MAQASGVCVRVPAGACLCVMPAQLCQLTRQSSALLLVAVQQASACLVATAEACAGCTGTASCASYALCPGLGSCSPDKCCWRPRALQTVCPRTRCLQCWNHDAGYMPKRRRPQTDRATSGWAVSLLPSTALAFAC